MIETKEAVSVRKLQFLCLLITGIMELLMIVIGTPFENNLIFYLVVPCTVFWGVTLAADQSRNARKPMILGAGVVLWFLISQGLQHIAGENPMHSGVSWSAYLMALPFAAALQDGKEQKGLDLFAICMICASVILSLFSVMLWAGILPPSMADQVYWDGARLYAKWHPNTAGRVFFIGAALCVRFFFRMPTKWGKTVMILLTALQFVVLVLTNSRTLIILMCVFFAGAVFFGIGYKGKRRLIAAFLAAAAVFTAAYGMSQVLFDKHNDVRVAEFIAEMEEKGEQVPDVPNSEIKLETEAVQGTLREDMGSFNGRTVIWKAAIRSLLSTPSIQLRGTADIVGAFMRGGCPYYTQHTHNSWLEMAVGFGIPGLLMALYFTILTLGDAAYLVFLGKIDPSQICVAMLLVCLLGAAFLEPFLFVGKYYSQYCNVVFFLGLGYMEQWRADIRSKSV